MTEGRVELLFGGARVVVSGRAARMIVLAATHASAINSAGAGALMINFGPSGQLKAELRSVLPVDKGDTVVDIADQLML